MKTSIYLTLIGLCLVLTVHAADPPSLINYQGVLRDDAGAPLNGDFDMIFTLYNVDMAGLGILIDTHAGIDAVTVSNGLLTARIGSGVVTDGPDPAGTYTSLSAVFSDYSEVWLELTINAEILSPRIRIISSAYSLNADHLDGFNSTDFIVTETDPEVTMTQDNRVPRWNQSQNTLVDGTIFDNGSEVGIGTASPDPQGLVDIVSTDRYGLQAETDSDDLNAWAVAARHSYYETQGYLGGTYYGVMGNAANSWGSGVYGQHEISANYGYLGSAQNGAYGEYQTRNNKGALGTYESGVKGSSTDDIGVTGVSTFNYGIRGVSVDSCGVYGQNEGMLNTGCLGTLDYGVYGHNWATDNYGYLAGAQAAVYGNSTSNNAIRGSSVDAHGVSGYSSTSYGVYGATTSGYAGWFNGNVNIVGTLSKGGGSFLIDHPLDPENKLLRHNFVESPEHLLIYRGKANLDETGSTVILMPDYFEALSKEEDASIMITPVGRPFLTGAEWYSDFMSFTIYGDPGREVFWQVLAGRDDPVIQELDLPVEEEKGSNSKICDKGELLYPTAYGYPETKRKDYDKEESYQ